MTEALTGRRRLGRGLEALLGPTREEAEREGSLVELPLARDDAYGMFEYACHEGNYAMFNILSGARADERAAAAK